MGYATGEAALLTLIRAHANYDSNNSSRQDWKIIKSGAAAYYVVLRPGEWTNAEQGMGTHTRSWRTIIECWRRYVDDSKPTALQADVIALVEYLEQYPTLNGTSGVQDAWIGGGGEMQEVTLENGSLWAKWEIYCDWKEEKSVSYS